VAIGAAQMIKLVGGDGWSNRPRPGRGFGGGGLGDPPTASHRSGDWLRTRAGFAGHDGGLLEWLASGRTSDLSIALGQQWTDGLRGRACRSRYGGTCISLDWRCC
jgi:hypothetical protein